MSKQARAMALLVLQNAALRDERERERASVTAAQKAFTMEITYHNETRAELKTWKEEAARRNELLTIYTNSLNEARTERDHMKGQLEAIQRDRDALAAELRAGREGNQHYAGELRTFFEGARALVGAEGMKDDCASVLQELEAMARRNRPKL